MCMIELLRLLPPGAYVPMDDLCARTGRTRSNVGAALRRLMLRDLVIRREEGCYAITAAGEEVVAAGIETLGPVAPSRLGQPRKACQTDKIWTALRIKGKASIAELQELAGTKERGTYAYVRALGRAGYVVRNRSSKVVLIKDTGPLAPRLRLRETVLLDRNTNEQVVIGGRS